MFEAGDQFRRVEERQSLWIFDSTKVQEATKKLQQHKEIFHEMHGILFSEYKVNIANLEKVDPKAILILNQTFDFQVVTSNWLAILPSIMQNLECTLDPVFPPCWRNKRGETACVSVGWQDGTWKHRNYDRHSPASKGWCVLMRAELWQEIEKNLGGKAIFLTGVRRELYQPSESQYEAICTKVVVEPGLA